MEPITEETEEQPTVADVATVAVAPDPPLAPDDEQQETIPQFVKAPEEGDEGWFGRTVDFDDTNNMHRTMAEAYEWRAELGDQGWQELQDKRRQIDLEHHTQKQAEAKAYREKLGPTAPGVVEYDYASMIADGIEPVQNAQGQWMMPYQYFRSAADPQRSPLMNRVINAPIVDIGRGVASGIVKGIVKNPAEFVLKSTPAGDLYRGIARTAAKTEGLLSDDARSGIHEYLDTNTNDQIIDTITDQVPLPPAPNEWYGQIAEGITQFAANYTVAGKGMGTTGFLSNTVRAAIADISAFDPNLGNFATMINGFAAENPDDEELQWLADNVLKYVDPTLQDSDLDKRFAMALEGVILQTGIDVNVQGVRKLISGVKGIRELAAKNLGMGAPPGSPGAQQGMVNFHGTPHKFDKFDLEKINSGEGTQMQGHGLYFGGREGTGLFYKETLSSGRDWDASFKDASGELFDLEDVAPPGVAEAMDQFGFPSYAIPELRAKNHFDRGYDPNDEFMFTDEQLTEAADWLEQNYKNIAYGKPGYIYEVDIPDEAIARMMDWDKPLKDQPENVQKVIKGMNLQQSHNMGPIGDLHTGKQIYQVIASTLQPTEGSLRINNKIAAKKASELLNKSGVPGIKYLDGVSRSKGEGTHNLVVFDDQLPTILKRNGEVVGGSRQAKRGIPEPYIKYAEEVEARPVTQVIDEPIVNADGKFRRNASGDITGAPEGVKGPRQVNAIVNRNVKALEDPLSQIASSADWYEVSGKAIRDITHGDAELTERVVRIMAALSPSNQVGGNTTGAIRAAYQIARGEVAAAGRFPNVFAKNSEAMLAAKDFDTSVAGVDSKVMSFYRNLWDATFQSERYESAATMDMWMARLFGYKGDSFGQAQYRFANHVTQKITDKYNAKHGTDYKPRQIQAALWVYARNSDAGVKVDDLVDDRSAFDTYINRARQNILLEAVPSERLGLFPEIFDAPVKAREAFTRDSMGVILGKHGNNELFDYLDIPLYQERPGAGSFEGRVNPNSIMSVVGEKVGGKVDTEKVNLAAKSLAYIYRQDGVPWAQFDPTLTGAKRMRVVEFGAKPSVEAQEAFLEHVGKSVDADFTVIDNSLVMINYKGLPKSKWDNLVDEAVSSYNGPEAKNIKDYYNGKSKGDNIKTDWSDEAAAAKALEGEIAAGGPPGIQERLRDWHEAYRSVIEKHKKQLGRSGSAKGGN